MTDFNTNSAQQPTQLDQSPSDQTTALPPSDHGTGAANDDATVVVDADLRYIALSQLIASPLNVRKRGGANVDELAMLIRSQGLLSALLVIPHVTKKGKPTDQYEVVAGGRRRRALVRLAELKMIPADEKVLCKITTRDKAVAVSIAENSAREPMSGPDTVQAFNALSLNGASTEDISVAFGISPMTVLRRLKLASVSPKLFELYRDEQISTEQMAALAIVDDHETQERVWEGASAYDRHPHTLRRLLLGREIDASRDPLALFVGVQAYQEAGGRIIRDLFEEDEDCGYIGDAELLQRLANEKLMAEATKLKCEGWSWTEGRASFDYSDRHHFGVAPKTLRDATTKERSKLDALESEHQACQDKLEALYDSDDEHDQAEADALENKIDKAAQAIDKLHAIMSTYAPEVLAVSGVVVSIDHAGKLIVHRGLIKPEDRVQAKKALAEVAGVQGGGSESDAGTDKPLISEALQRKLTAHRTKALQARLADNTHVALAAVVHVLVQQVIEVGMVTSALSIRGRGCEGALEQAASDMKGSKAETELSGRLDDWRERIPGDAGKLLPWLIGQDDSALLDLLALCAALSVDTVTTRDRAHPGDALASAVELDMADYWEATGPSYFAQVSKVQIAEAVTEALSAEQAAPLLKLKKGEAVAQAESIMLGTRWLPAALRCKEAP